MYIIQQNPEFCPLKTLFNTQGSEPEVWQFFRGDSFQLEAKSVENVLMLALKIKATVKCIKALDIKIAIGIGSKDYSAPKITESNGEAFIYSGELFDRMRKKNLAIKTNIPGKKSRALNKTP